jgi:hypothetical protein
VFPFATLHPNAGARLCSEISLLPDILLNPSTSFGYVTSPDHTIHSPMPTNVASSSTHGVQDAGRNAMSNGENLEENRRYFMCSPAGNSTGTDADLPTADTTGDLGSSSGSTVSQVFASSGPTPSPSCAHVTGSTGSSTPESSAPLLVDGSSSSQTDPCTGDSCQRIFYTDRMRPVLLLLLLCQPISSAQSHASNKVFVSLKVILMAL